jgi:hypothetical protein
MYESTTRRRCMAAAIGVLSLGAAGSAVAQSTAIAKDSALREAGHARHQFSIKTEPLRGATFRCGGLTLHATRGRSIETTDADLREGVARISISRVWRDVHLRGSDGLMYRASGTTAAWFVLHSPDFDTPVHGLEVNQVMFRGGPDKSPGWLRERIKWSHRHETDRVDGPCTFGDG